MKPANDQQENLDRVRISIGDIVREFVLAQRGEWTSAKLRAYVSQRAPSAPASADRILRDLRQRGEIDYVVVDRSKSTYVTVKSERRAA